MKTICIRNGLFWSGLKKLRVMVNGNEYIMHDLSMNFNVDENSPFEIRIKRGWTYSPTYQFEPKNITWLQISENRRVIVSYFLIFMLPLIFSFFFSLKPYVIYLYLVFLLFFMVHYIIMRKKFFVIREKNNT